MGRLKHHIDRWSMDATDDQDYHHMREWPSTFLRFLQQAHNQKTFPGFDIWNIKYQDEHGTHSFIKIDSHQLSQDRKTIKAKKNRYKNSIPCRSLLQANHIADVGTKLIINHYNLDRLNSSTSASSCNWWRPYSNIRYYFTWHGRRVDKDISTFIEDTFHAERLKQLKHKETQGLLARMFIFCSASNSNLPFNSEHKRLLCGLTNTHTLCLQKHNIQGHESASNLEISLSYGDDDFFWFRIS